MNFSQEIPEEKTGSGNHVIEAIQDAWKANDNDKAFILIFATNIKGCVINVCGGALLGIGTVANLAINGFAASDAFVCSYESGFSIKNILKTTLPHSPELIGFWLSGAMGFMIAWQLVLFMRGKESWSKGFLKRMCIYAICVFLIILCSAYIEAHISINMV